MRALLGTLTMVLLLFAVLGIAAAQTPAPPAGDLFPFATVLAVVLNAVVAEIVKRNPRLPNLLAPWLNYALGVLINAGFPIGIARAAGVEVAAQVALPSWLAIAANPVIAPLWQQALAHWLTKTIKVHWLTARAVVSGTAPPGVVEQ